MKDGEKNNYFKWRPHPWHGLSTCPNPPELVSAFIEITPFDLVKYEIDKITGYLRVDRPQKSSSLPPMLYGFIPKTYCGPEVSKLSPKAENGDGDPLDICVISEANINRAEVIIDARVIGVVQTLDHNQADDKIIAVIENDPLWNKANDISDIPEILINRLQHYFGTYKMESKNDSKVEIMAVRNQKQAFAIIEAAIEDYSNTYG